MNKHTYRIVIAAMLSAISFVLMFLETSIPIIPSFVKLDISDIPELLGAFSLGPFYGVVISFVKNVLHALIRGTSTQFIGEVANFSMGAVFSFTAGIIYRFNKTKKGAIIGTLIGAVAMGLASFPINFFITYPVYAAMFGGMENIIAAYKAIWSGADQLWKCLLFFNVPFTLCKGLLCGLVCIFIYKPLSPLLHGKR